MYEAYKFSITVALFVILSFVFTKTLVLSSALLVLALFYHFDFEYYPPQRRVNNKVIRLSLKVRNSKINDVFTKGIQMQNKSNSGLWMQGGYRSFSPNSSGAMEPKITSTPISRIQHRKEVLLTPRPATGRYSLSNMSLSQIPAKEEKSRTSPIQNISGPLLASTRYHNNVGTYMDSRSPGLSSRIVQYSKDAEHRPTHQAKYGRPGVFPVVHLFNKEKAVSPKPKTVTLRFAPSDTLTHYNPEQSKLLLNGAFKDPVTNKTTLLPQTTTIGPVENDTSTRSVLDALKEISRKRIHTNEDLEDTLDPCKKQKKETSKKEAYQKRAREDSPQGDSLAKRSCCYIDAFTASVTSSQRYKQELEKGVKRKEMLENKRKEKIVKLNQDVETQTRSKETSLPVVEKSTSTEEIVEEQIKEEEDVPWMPVFDDRPLAEARKKRLAKLLGSLTGHKPYIEPPTDDTETFAKQRQREEEEKKQQEAEEKKLVSILSPPNKAKHDKHVTFNMQPQTTSVESIVVISESTATTDQSTITTATVSSSEAREKPVPPVLFGFNSNTTTVSAISSPVTTSLPLATNITSTISSAIATPTFSFGKPTITSPPHTTIAAASPPKIGGFKFDLIASSTATTVTSAISTSGFTATTTSLGNFKIPTTSAFTIPPFKKESETTKTTMSSGFKLPAATSQSFVLPSTTPSFSIPTSTVSQNSNSAAAITSSTFTLSTPTTANFMFNKASSTTPTTTIAATKPFLFTPTTSSGMPKNLFSSGSSGGGFANPTTTTASFSFSPTATSTTTGFAVAKTTNIFGTVSSAPTFGQTSAVPAFGTTATTKKGTTTSSMMPFGIAKTSAPSIFAQTTIAPSTGNVFGSTTPAFGVVSTITTTATSNNTPTAPIFGSVTTTISSSIFGTQTPSVNVFGTSTTTAPSFTAAFSAAVTTASLFGATSTAITTAAPVFGSSYAGTATTTSSSLFPSASPSFGAQTTTTDATKPVNIFSSGGAPSFGSSQPGGFGGFGANTTSPFGATSSGFGATKQETPKVFGTPSTPAFGTSSTPTFGASSDKSSAFGNTTTAPAFGGFNAPAKPAFTAANTASPQTSNVFGASNQSAPFGAHNANQSFGSSSNVPQTGSAFTFGAAANSTAKPAAFNFGANTEPPKPGGFNFGATAPPSFGASSPAFGGNFTSQFNAPAAGTFSIGSGSAPNRSRTTLRAKRRN